MKRLNQAGYTLIELLIAVGIMSLMASSVMVARTMTAKASVKTLDVTYASEKAIQMFEELKALVGGRESKGVDFLDQYDDPVLNQSGVSFYNPVLTTDKTVDISPPPGSGNPGDPLSGNKKTNGYWRYLRRVTVSRLINDPYARQVDVRVWLAEPTNPSVGTVQVADVGGVLRTISDIYPPSQTMDVYCLAIQNIPAWWAQLAVVFTTFTGIVNDIQNRNPGLFMRPHYITRSSYGRDQNYIPYINDVKRTDSVVSGGVIPYVYFYPGSVPDDNSVTNTFYNYGNTGVQYTGTFNIDSNITSTAGQFPGCPTYAVADRNNNSLRYPDELAVYQAVTAAAAVAPGGTVGASNPVTEISERMLLEGMLSSPLSFQNALIFNLHGEDLPIPPMRNYSDAAKDPMNTSGSGGFFERVVTHPQCLYYPTNLVSNIPITLMVYAYYDGLDDWTKLDTNTGEYTGLEDVSGAGAHHPVLPFATILIDQVINPASVKASAIVGNSSVVYSEVNNIVNGGGAGGGIMTVTNVGAPVSQTMITLSNIPLRCVANGNGGLNSNDRLYGAEYIPCPVEATQGNAFTQNLATLVAGPGEPKNTARWILSLPVAAGVVTVETCIGNGVTHSAWPLADNSPNISRTYVWVGNNNPPPFTERYQYLGDPRDCPYMDNKWGTAGVFGSVSGNSTTIEANSFNWWFKNETNIAADGYAGFNGYGLSAAVSGWAGDVEEVDMPRFMETLRTGLLSSTALWSAMNGYTDYYYSMGGEFGSDQPPFSAGITINQTIYATTPQTGTYSVQEMITSSNGGNFPDMKVIANTAGTWYERSWLGELYPDELASYWLPPSLGGANGIGNLTIAGPVADTTNFYREDYISIPVKTVGGTSNSLNGFGRSLYSRSGPIGCTSFYNGIGIGTGGGGAMNHDSEGEIVNLLSLGQTCYNIFEYPLAAAVSCTRPWSINTTNLSTEWEHPPYPSLRTTMMLSSVNGTSRLFYSCADANGNGPWHATGAIQVAQPNPVAGGPASQYAYILESGLAVAANVGTNDLAETAMVCLLRSFLDGGNFPVGQGHIYQVPLIQVYCDNPTAQYFQPTNINLLVSGAVTTGVPLTIAGFATFNSGPITNIWLRYPGFANTGGNFYTEEYPGYPNVLNSTYSEPVSQLDFNIKVSSDYGGNWGYIQDGIFTGAVTGILDPNLLTHCITTTSMPLTFAWSVPAASFPQNDYLVCAEAYRHGYPLDYSSHILDISITR